MDVPYHRLHRFLLDLRRAIAGFEDRSIALLDGEVEVDETYFGSRFKNRRRLVLEHYTTAGMLDCVLEEQTPAAPQSEVISPSLILQLDHAAYLGRELACAENSLLTGKPYVQDRAPGATVTKSTVSAWACGDSCGAEGKS